MNPQVLTTSMSASAGSSTSTWPSARTRPSITSVSTWFFGQPRLTKYTFFAGPLRPSEALPTMGRLIVMPDV
jgi:hypothetical protein